MAWDIRNLVRPVAPGMSGAINPLTFIGSGMATGDIGGSLARMGELQMAGQRLAMQQTASQAALTEARRVAKEAETMKTLAPGVAKEMFPESANMQQFLAQNPALMNQLIVQQEKARLEGLQAAQEAASAAAVMPDQGMSRDEFLKEYNPTDFTNFAEVFAQGGQTGSYDPGQLVRRIEPSDFRAEAGRAEKKLSNIQQAVQSSNQVLTSLGQATGVGDITATIGMMKILDPTSVVSGAEQRVIKQAGGLYNNILGMLRDAKGQGSLAPAVRAEIHDNVMALLGVYQQENKRIRGDISSQASAMGMQPSMIMPSPFNWPTPGRYPRPVAEQERADNPEAKRLIDKYLENP